MQGCSLILTEKECDYLKYGSPGMLVDVLIRPRFDGWLGLVLCFPTTNRMLPALLIEGFESKVLFEIKENFGPYGLSYEYDSTLSQIAALISDFRSEIFDGSCFLSKSLEKMAQATLKKCGTRQAAIKWLLFDESPAGCSSLSQFLLGVIYRS